MFVDLYFHSCHKICREIFPFIETFTEYYRQIWCNENMEFGQTCQRRFSDVIRFYLFRECIVYYNSYLAMMAEAAKWIEYKCACKSHYEHSSSLKRWIEKVTIVQQQKSQGSGIHLEHCCCEIIFVSKCYITRVTTPIEFFTVQRREFKQINTLWKGWKWIQQGGIEAWVKAMFVYFDAKLPHSALEQYSNY